MDVWALGVLLYLLAYGRLPFEGEAKLQVLNGRVPAPPEAEAAGRPPQLASLVRDMLTVSPRQRPTIRQVLVRLREMAPPELWQEGQGHGVQQAGSGAPPLHERVPSQGWADFASEGSGAASLGRMGSGGGSDAGHGSFTRRLSGSGSWATFSPTKGGEGVGPAAGAATAAAGVGSFWSSFGEEAPLTDAQPADAQPAGAPEEQQQAQQQQAQQQQWQQHEEPQAQAGAQRPPVPAPQLLPVAARQQAAPPAAAAAAAPLVEPADISPLSAGLARMSQPAFTVVGSSAATLPAHPAAASPAAPFTGGESGAWGLAMGPGRRRLIVLAPNYPPAKQTKLRCCCPPALQRAQLELGRGRRKKARRQPRQQAWRVLMWRGRLRSCGSTAWCWSSC